jgi:MoaA/NifB/PqqE/SkfB family radical SAM enzyme
MPAEPFALVDAERVLQHPDTPAAYAEWREVLPLTGEQDRTHLGNLLGWSHRVSQRPLGASRALFEQALGAGDDAVDRWMERLAQTPAEDFCDHFVPFLRNVACFPPTARDRVVGAFLDAAERPLAPEVQPLPGRKLYRSSPDAVIVEITRSCNFACTMCSSRTGGFVPERTMPLPVFGEVVRVLGPLARSLRINGYGETTLVPNLASYLDCLDEFAFSGLREIITNLSAPPPVYADLFARGFVILVSWDATTAPTFEHIRVGARFEEQLATLRSLGIAARVQPERLGLLATIQETNLSEIESLVRQADEVGAGLLIYNMVNEPDGSPWMEARRGEILERFAAADRLGTELGVTLRIPDHLGGERIRLNQSRRSSTTFCDRPWRELLVRWDTEVSVCNMFNPFSYGMLRPPGPPREMPSRHQRLWNGPNAALFRSIINREPHPYCDNCYFLYP